MGIKNRTWIFQCNPNQFDFDGYLAASLGMITWRVSRYQNEIKPGDTVFFWKSVGDEKNNSGIFAEGEILENPIIQNDDDLSSQFWLDETRTLDQQQYRVKIRLRRVADGQKIIKRDWLHEDGILADLQILKAPQGTNFRTTEEQAHRIIQLWQKKGQDWKRDELVAALFLYEEYNRGANKIDKKFRTQEIAQLIGRVTPSVSFKLGNFHSLDTRNESKGFQNIGKLDKTIWDEFFNKKTKTMDFDKLNFEFIRLWKQVENLGQHALETDPDEVMRLSKKPEKDLLEEYQSRLKNERPMRKTQVAYTYVRDPLIVALRSKLADRQCEIEECTCHKIITSSGVPFIEIHHIIPLSEGGQDTLENTAALCPNHHREVHHGRDKMKLRDKLLSIRESSI